MKEATYLYCVVRRARKPPARGVPPGVPGGSAPMARPLAPATWLVVSEVPLDRYRPARLEPLLADIDQVAAIALAHEAVVEHFTRMAGATVVPVKLFTMFSSADKAVAAMRRRRSSLARVLEQLHGAEEWGVRVSRTRPASRVSPAGRPSSGTAFLAGRKQARDDARMRGRLAAEAAEAAFEGLATLARASRRRQDAPAGATPPLLDAAFLVPARSRTRFKAEARRLATACSRAGAEMTLTGPWPAYNFVQAGETIR